MRIPRVLTFVIAVLLVAAAASACASETGGTATLPDGTYFGFVHTVSAGGTLVFDPAEWFSGDAAVAAARADGAIGADEDLSDPFYVRNPQVETLRLQVDPVAQFVLLVAPEQSDLVEKTVSLDELAQLSSGAAGSDNFYSGFPLPMDVTVSGSKVTGGKQHYMP